MSVGGPPQWRDVLDLVRASEERILEAARDIKESVLKLSTRVDLLEDKEHRREGSKKTTAFFLTLPGRIIGLLASAAALVLALAGVWALLGKL